MCAKGAWQSSITQLQLQLPKAANASAMQRRAIVRGIRTLIPGLLAGALMAACAAPASSAPGIAAQVEAAVATASAATLIARGTSTPSPTPLPTALVITATPRPQPVENLTPADYLKFAAEIHMRQAAWMKSVSESRAKLAQDPRLLTQDSEWSTAYAALLDAGFAIAAAVDSAGVPKACLAYHEELQVQAKALRLATDRLLTFVATLQDFNNGEADELLETASKNSAALQADPLRCK